MNCNEALELFTESLASPLDGRAAADLEAHLASCDACAAEATELRRIWKELERLPEELPGEEMRQRFAATLAPLVAEAGERQRRERSGSGRVIEGLGTRLEAWLAGWLPRRPLAQAGLAAAALAVGVLVGAGAPFGGWHLVPTASGAAGKGDVAELRDEIHSLSRLVTLSLLKQDSASERLRGVSFGRQAGAADERVLEALLDTLARDPDVNVRLAAVDALAQAAGRPLVRDQLLQEVVKQRSPMVQIALVDLLVTHDRAGSRQRLLELAANPNLDETVRGYLRSKLNQVS
jgi:Putative zinc-finger